MEHKRKFYPTEGGAKKLTISVQKNSVQKCLFPFSEMFHCNSLALRFEYWRLMANWQRGKLQRLKLEDRDGPRFRLCLCSARDNVYKILNGLICFEPIFIAMRITDMKPNNFEKICYMTLLPTCRFSVSFGRKNFQKYCRLEFLFIGFICVLLFLFTFRFNCKN